jgi:hypothetical protein
MRLAILVLFSLFLATTSLFAPIGVAHGDDPPKSDSIQDPRREWFKLADGRTEFEISDPNLMPKPLATAVEQSNCGNYKERMKETPVRFLRVKNQRLAIVFCPGDHLRLT